ncbi:MAG: NupC/NupG family nucleoside CNT transporter [Leptolyngbya sp. PLA1]|nr:NupC/NupG family nucleoside CNT transporter [Leptolyngbya sp. PLA1]
MADYRGLLAVGLFVLMGYLLSTDRRRVNLRVVLGGLILQIVVALVCLRVPGTVEAIDLVARGFTRVIGFADEGTRFLFGSTADASGPWGFIFVIRVLPVIIFFAALMAVLYHLRVMQVLVAGLAWVLRRTLGITGAEATSAAANIFFGQTEAPLTVKPYIPTMTRSQIMAVMTGGFATIAGSVMAAYVTMLGGESIESRVLFAKHLLTASVMSAPAGLVMAKLMLPETESPRDEGLKSLWQDDRGSVNVLDAAASGATDGLKLALNVAAMLAAFVALIAMLNWPLSLLGPDVNFQSVLGWCLRPLAWCMGFEWDDARAAGGLMGTQVIATEFVAYVDLSEHAQKGTMSPRACQIAAYALCGFANLPSLAIQIGGLSAVAPERRVDFVRIAPRAMLGGALACWMTASIAGVLIR